MKESVVKKQNRLNELKNEIKIAKNGRFEHSKPFLID